MEMSRAEFAEKKSIRDYLRSILMTNLSISQLHFKNGKVYKFTSGYGPWKDEYDLITSDIRQVEKYRLLLRLEDELSKAWPHERRLEAEEMSIKIRELIKKYTADELSME